jgi:amino acid transporter
MKYLSVIITVIILTLAFSVIGFFYYWVFQNSPLPPIFKVFILIFIIGLIIALFYVAVERIKEIKKEKDDDLSKY